MPEKNILLKTKKNISLPHHTLSILFILSRNKTWNNVRAQILIEGTVCLIFWPGDWGTWYLKEGDDGWVGGRGGGWVRCI